VVSTLLLFGLYLLITAYKQWRGEDDPDAPPPKWLTMMDSLTPLKACVIGVGLPLVSVKLWVITLGALGTIAEAQLGQPGSAIAYLLFIWLAQSLLLIPILIRILIPARSQSILDGLSDWLAKNNRPIVMVVSYVRTVLFVLGHQWITCITALPYILCCSCCAICCAMCDNKPFACHE
jgi:hypothetical protein